MKLLSDLYLLPGGYYVTMKDRPGMVKILKLVWESGSKIAILCLLAYEQCFTNVGMNSLTKIVYKTVIINSQELLETGFALNF